MHVLMLGWEFPPFITGGLGTACHGLTRALDARGTRITFVLPKAVGGEPSHVNLISPESDPIANAADTPPQPSTAAAPAGHTTPAPSPSPTSTPSSATQPDDPFLHTQFIHVHSGFLHPYDPKRPDQPVGSAAPPTEHAALPRVADRNAPATDPAAPHESTAAAAHSTSASPSSPSDHHATAPVPRPPTASDYAGDIVDQCERYAAFCIAAVQQRRLDFDVIHAHDWMTYPAGLAIARLTGKPLIVHIHSTEFDRSGQHVNQRIYDIERRGMHGALRVIAVSQLTKNIVVSRYGVPARRVEVVYNGVEFEPTNLGLAGIRSSDKIVLYFGRITYQKGPAYFVRAAKRVLEVIDDVKFVVAGSGDLAQHMMQMANDFGIGDKVLFTGFLRGRDIQRVFAMADLYVMPSISEPFGIAPLEAMSHDVPVLISRSSGVSEVLTHALKVDFWDVDDMANKIVAVLRHPPLSNTLREHGAMEVRTLTWDGAAQRCQQIYTDVIHDMAHSPVVIDTSAFKRKSKPTASPRAPKP